MSNQAMEDERISIIIPAWEEETVLHDTLNSIEGVDYRPDLIDVTIVAGGGKTIEIARSFCEKSGLNAQVLVQDDRSGKNQAILQGIRATDGQIIVLLDADTVVTKGWLEGLVKMLREGYDVVNGHQEPVVDNWVTRYELASNEMMLAKNGLVYLLGNSSIALRRESIAAKMEEYFDPRVYRGVDWMLTKKLRENGSRIGYAKDALVKTHIASTLNEFIVQHRRWDDACLPYEVGMYGYKGRLYYALMSCSLLATIIPGLWSIPALAVLCVYGLRRATDFRRTFGGIPRFSMIYTFQGFISWMALDLLMMMLSTISLLSYLVGASKSHKRFKGPRPVG
ncbi:glycosyltransferase [Candidatus Altiarchaeota archaeon]